MRTTNEIELHKITNILMEFAEKLNLEESVYYPIIEEVLNEYIIYEEEKENII